MQCMAMRYTSGAMHGQKVHHWCNARPEGTPLVQCKARRCSTGAMQGQKVHRWCNVWPECAPLVQCTARRYTTGAMHGQKVHRWCNARPEGTPLAQCMAIGLFNEAWTWKTILCVQWCIFLQSHIQCTAIRYTTGIMQGKIGLISGLQRKET